MKARLLLAGLLALLGAGICLGQNKKTQEKPSTPLIRMDLLRKKESDIAVVKRDIFVAQSSVSAMPMALPVAPGANPSSAETKTSEEPQELALSLRYMGYIQGGQKFLALILFENQAMAVAEGELVGPAWKVIRIEPGTIELQGPDEKTQKFALEGERK